MPSFQVKVIMKKGMQDIINHKMAKKRPRYFPPIPHLKKVTNTFFFYYFYYRNEKIYLYLLGTNHFNMLPLTIYDSGIFSGLKQNIYYWKYKQNFINVVLKFFPNA